MKLSHHLGGLENLGLIHNQGHQSSDANSSHQIGLDWQFAYT